ncbi:MAG TPA: hypothetical protein VD994_15020 [Prosthecobacter sp.]|nr:hypothetical protein [Prosthecobacter sp.]
MDYALRNDSCLCYESVADLLGRSPCEVTAFISRSSFPGSRRVQYRPDGSVVFKRVTRELFTAAKKCPARLNIHPGDTFYFKLAAAGRKNGAQALVEHVNQRLNALVSALRQMSRRRK